MKITKKLTALFLALAMALSLCTVAMADGSGKPVATRATEKPSTIQSVTIGGVVAVYQVDGYGNTANPTYDDTQVFIRATLPSTTTEEELKDMTVVITVTSGSSISGGTLRDDAGEFSQSGNVYTAEEVDLLNNAYTIVIGGTTYIIAAGIEDNDQAHATISTEDPLAISNVTFNNATTTAEVYRTTVQNPCMGNPYFVDNPVEAENGWTLCNYFISASNVPAVTTTSAVPVTFTKNASATLSGNISSITGTTSVTATANLSGNIPALTVTANGNSRTYVMMVSYASQMITVTFGFDFSELKGTTYYTGDVKTEADEIATAAAAYFNGSFAQPWGTIQVASGSTVMDVLQAFMLSASYTEYDPDSTYVESINGLAAFDTSGMDGWMYTDTTDGWSEDCNIPMVGAADYTLSADDRITWFYTTNYMTYWG